MKNWSKKMCRYHEMEHCKMNGVYLSAAIAFIVE